MKWIVIESMIVSGIVFILVMTSIPQTISKCDATGDEDIVSNLTDQSKASWYIADGKSYIEQPTENIKNIDLPSNIDDGYAVIADGSVNSSWPMLSHDLHHTGRSPHNTVNNQGTEKWWFKVENDLSGYIESSAVTDNNGTIYFGDMGADGCLYALYSNGTKKWSRGIGTVWSTPAIDEDGAIYVATTLGYAYLHAIYSNNGTLKWKYSMGGTFSSPVVANDGTIVFGDDNRRIIALYPNGTEKWVYPTGDFVASSPAIGDDGMIHIGSSDGYLYALYPNGTLRWKFGTGGWIKGHPSIAGDGTIYAPSFDGYLYALYQNGTEKWRADTGGSIASAGAVIASDGTLYVGTDMLRAFYPSNGTLKWSCDVGDNIYGTVPAVSADGTIYVSADHDGSGGDLVAVNQDGTVRWRQRISNQYARSSPCIGEDGTIYVGSTIVNEGGYSLGYLHAFNNLDPNAPSAPEIDGLTKGKPKKEYDYTFTSVSPLGRDVFYYVDWGDGKWTDWTGPYSSGEEVTLSHTWSKQGTYTIRSRAKDTENLWGPWGELEIEMPVSYNSLIQRFLGRFTQAFPILQNLLGFC